ncbi:hypothetical protein L6R46_08260 [Myxococcota bacterium]|jgi:hypothetical protein|nr:hypothetical protein [Myxococcota bacterium]
MIRIARGDEPPALRRERHKRLAVARLKKLRGGAFSDEDLRGYDVAREALWEAQNRRCAYCETEEDLDEHAVEHFRPKGCAYHRLSEDRTLREDTDSEYAGGYWWLTWSWENLLFSCATCNGRSHKGSLFPIFGDPLAELDTCIDAEQALLIDPTREDPLDLMEWVPREEEVNDEVDYTQWCWIPRPIAPTSHPSGLSPVERANTTIRVFKLDGTRVERISHTIRTMLCGWVKPTLVHLSLGEETRARARWDDLTRWLSTTQHSGACWSALRRLREHQPALRSLSAPPRPGRHDAPPPAAFGGLPPTPPGVSDERWLRQLETNTPTDEQITILSGLGSELSPLCALQDDEARQHEWLTLARGHAGSLDHLTALALWREIAEAPCSDLPPPLVPQEAVALLRQGEAASINEALVLICAGPVPKPWCERTIAPLSGKRWQQFKRYLTHLVNAERLTFLNDCYQTREV